MKLMMIETTAATIRMISVRSLRASMKSIMQPLIEVSGGLLEP